MSEHIELGAQMDAGLFGGMMRSALGGESLFSQTLSAPDGDGDAVLAAPEVGDVELMQLTPNGTALLLQKGAFLAADDTVDISTATQRSLSGALFSGAGLFVLRASGRGTLAVTAHGSILRFDLRHGETRAVDNGHLVAWDEPMGYEVRLAGGSRRGGGSLFGAAFSSAASGEGLMCFFHGPGTVWLQTHKPDNGGGGSSSAGSNDSGGQRRRSSGGGGGGLAGLCVCMMIFLLIVVGAGAFFVVIPAMGGHWVQEYPGGSYVLKFGDKPSSPPPVRRRVSGSAARSSSYSEGRGAYGEEYPRARSREYDEL